ncbi:hypothetical protein B4079_0999 [Bacillus cereus]|nr:hypothetical protein B4079_0999 [Bacillus cereus]
MAVLLIKAQGINHDAFLLVPVREAEECLLLENKHLHVKK